MSLSHNLLNMDCFPSELKEQERGMQGAGRVPRISLGHLVLRCTATPLLTEPPETRWLNLPSPRTAPGTSQAVSKRLQG